jgi:hypothetical protein
MQSLQPISDKNQMSFIQTHGLLILLLLNIFLFAGGFYLSYQLGYKTGLDQTQRFDQALLIHLVKIDQSIQKVTDELKQNHQSSKQYLETIVKQLNAMQSTLASIQDQTNPKQLQTMIMQTSQALITKQFNEIKSKTSTASHKHKKAKHRHHHYARLPFRVLGIDIWNGETEATVSYLGDNTLLSKGDSLSGWTLVNLAFDPGHAVFRSNHGQTVTVRLLA